MKQYVLQRNRNGAGDISYYADDQHEQKIYEQGGNFLTFMEADNIGNAMIFESWEDAVKQRRIENAKITQLNIIETEPYVKWCKFVVRILKKDFLHTV